MKNRNRSHFSISAVAGVCAVISQVKTWVNYDWIDDCSRSLNRSRILKFEEYPGPDADPASSEISDLCEISDLLVFFSYFASQNKEIKSGNYFFDVCCGNQNIVDRCQITTTSDNTGITLTAENFST